MKQMCYLLVWSLVMASNVSKADDPKCPFDIDDTALEAKKGQYVLCPPRIWIDNANEKGANRQSFIYYTSVVEEVGESCSIVKSLAGKTQKIPNQMIIPIKPEHKAKKGDIVLTWWQTGSGMQRAIVVGGSEKEPVVKYLDIKMSNPTGVAKKEYPIKANSFHVLDKQWQVGTAVMVESGSGFAHGQILAITDKKVLVRKFAGLVEAVSRDRCTAIPLKPSCKADDQVFVPIIGKMNQATVVSVDETNGRVVCKFKFGGKDKEEAIAFGDVAIALPEK